MTVPDFIRDARAARRERFRDVLATRAAMVHYRRQRDRLTQLALRALHDGDEDGRKAANYWADACHYAAMSERCWLEARGG
jgi:hypothetical protein